MLRPQGDLDFDLESHRLLNLYQHFVESAGKLDL